MHKYNEYYKFTIIRDPIEKLISAYFYQMNHIINIKKNKDPRMVSNLNEIIKLYKKYNIDNIYSFLNNFKIFYKNEVEPKILDIEYISKTEDLRYYYLGLYFPQYLFICDNEYNILVDDVININQIDKFMKDKFNIKNDTKKIHIKTVRIITISI